MTRVLLVGLKPEAVNYSDPALPAGMNAKKIQAAIDLGIKQMTDRGWQAEACLIQHDATAGPAVERRLPTSKATQLRLRCDSDRGSCHRFGPIDLVACRLQLFRKAHTPRASVI